MISLECHPAALEVLQAFRNDVLSNIAITLTQPNTCAAPAGFIVVPADEVVPGAKRIAIPLFSANFLNVLAIQHDVCWLIFYARPDSRRVTVMSEAEIDNSQNFHIELIDILESLSQQE